VKSGVTFNGRELAEAICKHHLAKLADPSSGLPDVNKYGVVVKYHLKRGHILFNFVTKDKAQIRFIFNVTGFQLAPKVALMEMHTAINGGLEIFRKQRQEDTRIEIHEHNKIDPMAFAVKKAVDPKTTEPTLNGNQ